MKGGAFYATVEIHPRLLDPQANIKTSINIRTFLKVVHESFFFKKKMNRKQQQQQQTKTESTISKTDDLL